MVRNSSRGRRLIGEIERPGDVELLDRRPVVKQHQKLDLGGTQVHDVGFVVGFELAPAAVPGGLSPLARGRRRWKRIAKDFQFVVPVLQVLLGVLQHRFGLQALHEGASQVEDEAALLIFRSRTL